MFHVSLPNAIHSGSEQHPTTDLSPSPLLTQTHISLGSTDFNSSELSLTLSSVIIMHLILHPFFFLTGISHQARALGYVPKNKKNSETTWN